MAKVYDGIDPDMAAWIERQPVFFVATAPLAADGLVNLSPKGTIGTFRVAAASTFAYLDVTGSGIETIAHLQENGRVCVMFCSFDRRPTIVRLHGTGRAVLAGDPAFEAELAAFGEAGTSRRPYLRAVIVVDVAGCPTPAGTPCRGWSCSRSARRWTGCGAPATTSGSRPTTPRRTRRAWTGCPA